jgi:drug/metabolite transporter (DMT)-like permease
MRVAIPPALPKYLTGLLTMALMVAASFVTQRLENEEKFSRPLFIAYVTTSSLTLLGVGQFFHLRWAAGRRGAEGGAGGAGGGAGSAGGVGGVGDLGGSSADIGLGGGGGGATVPLSMSPEDIPLRGNVRHTHLDRIRDTIKMPLTKFAMRAVPLSALWVASNFLLVSSFKYIDIASGLAVEQATATACVFIFSVILLGAPATVPRIIAVLVCIAGVIAIGLAPDTDDAGVDGEDSGAGTGGGDGSGERPHHNLALGILFATLAALASAVLMVSTKMFLAGLHGLPAVTVLLSAVGLSVLTMFWPFLLIAEATGSEELGLPGSQTGAVLLIVATVLVFGFNYSLNCGIAISSPLLMRIMTICNIPTSFAVQYIFLGSTVNWYKVLGGVLVVIGFVGFAVVSEREARAFARKLAALEAAAVAAAAAAGDIDAGGGGSGGGHGAVGSPRHNGEEFRSLAGGDDGDSDENGDSSGLLRGNGTNPSREERSTSGLRGALLESDAIP